MNRALFFAEQASSIAGRYGLNFRKNRKCDFFRAFRANIQASVKHLRHGSEIIEQLIQKAGLVVVGAEYSLETGVVDFFDAVPKTHPE